MSRSSRSRSRNDEDTRNQLSLDLDIKRVRPIINQYESTHRSNNQDEIVPSLGLHMLQTGGRNGSRPHQSDECVDSKDEGRGEPVQNEYYQDVETFRDVKPQPPRKIVKGFIIIVLLFLQGALMYSVYMNRPSDSTKQAGHSSLEDHLKHGLTKLTHIFASIAAAFGTKNPFPLVRLKKRLKLGHHLLNELNDPVGANVACSSVANAVIHHFGGNTAVGDNMSSYIVSVVAFLDEGESRLLADALLCMGEAKLVLFSPASASTPSVNNAEMKNAELLYAKDALEASASVDPMNPSIRTSLGLTFLLLGTFCTNLDGIVKYLSQATQHLNVAVKSAKSNDATRLAATHNLGLANLALGSIKADKSSQFLDLVPSLQIDSSVLLANEGAALLQVGKTDDAISSFEITSQLLACNSENMAEGSRQSDTCSLLQRNLAAANALVHEDHTEARESENQPTEDHEQSLDSLMTLDDAPDLKEVDSPVIESSETKNETVKHGGFESPTEDTTDSLSADDDLHSEKSTTPQLQSALQALENAASEGQHRPRLLLALAKARASTGDIAGAIDATLTAINHTTSVEETETLSTYLETLMSKLAGEITIEASEHQTDQHTYDRASKSKSDRTVSELELSLEIERLKYRVLEQEYALKFQEMRLGGGQNQIDYAAIGRNTIDYKPESRSTQTSIKPIESGTPTHDEESLNDESFGEIEIEESSPEHVDDSTGESLLDDSDESNTNDVSAPENTTESLDEVDEAVLSLNATEKDTLDNGSLTSDEADVVAEISPKPEPITLPSLYNPPPKPPVDLSATAKSYMKIADAYLDKGKYALASKQFLKVIRKAPDHLAAHLGYATALERAGKNKQLNEAAAAYGNATKVAIAQGDKVDSIAKAGTGGMGESILRRALQIAQSASSGRLELLRTLSTYAHTAALAADLYYAVGMELTKQVADSTQADAVEAFTIANEFIVVRNDTDAPCHIPSIIELGKIALDQGDSARAIDYFEKVKRLHLEDADHVKLLVLSGKAHAAADDLETAINDLTRALSFPQYQSTASAHHELALALTKNSGESHEINLHFEKALDLGMDPTDEAIAALGEHNMSIMRSYNRQHWRQMNEGHQGSSSGGIMGGGGVSPQKSVFAPQAGQEEQPSAQAETLSLLEQGAASYDGHVPMGGEVEGGVESNLSGLSGRKRT